MSYNKATDAWVGFRHLFTVCPLGTCLYNYVHKLECHKLSQARAEPAGIVDIN